MLSVSYPEQYLITLPDGHKFPIVKYRLLREELATDRRLFLQVSPLALTEEIILAHDQSYVHSILTGSIGAAQLRRIGLPWSESLVRRSLASVGGTLAAARRALNRGISGNLAGGTHHAFRGEGSGFCVFNDIAVAILVLRRDGLLRRAAVVDLDVHQGDGTASIFQDDPEVLTLSIHAESNFPFRKQKSSIDIGLPDGMGDEQYLEILRGVLPEVWSFRPDLVLYQAGVDALAEDRLGKLSLTHGGLVRRDRMVFEGAVQHNVPLAIVLGGGYAHPIELTVQAHANTFRTAASVWLGE